jgi:hypothetical protein
MPTYTFRGGTSNNVWGATANWSPTGIPNGLDPVIFDNISPGVTVNSAGNCSSINCTTGYTGTFTFDNNGSANIRIAVGTTGAGLTFSSGMGITCLGTVAGNFVISSPVSNGTVSITTNSIPIPRIQISDANVVGSHIVNLVINDSLNITSRFSAAWPQVANLRIFGGTATFTSGVFYTVCTLVGNSTLRLAPPPGGAVTYSSNTNYGSTPQGISLPIHIAGGAGSTTTFVGTHAITNGSVRYFSGNVAFAPASNPNAFSTGHHRLLLGGTCTLDTGGMVWDTLMMGSQPAIGGENYFANCQSDLRVGADLLTGSIGILNFAQPTGRLRLTGERIPATGTFTHALYCFAGGITNAQIAVTGTGTRLFYSSIAFNNSLIDINMSSGTCHLGTPPGVTLSIPLVGNTAGFAASFGGVSGCTFTKTSTPEPTVNGQRFALTVAGPTASTLRIPSLTGGTLSVTGVGGLAIGQPTFFNTATVSGTGGINITSPVRFENLTSISGNFRGSLGWTATNFTAAGNTTFRAGLTYSVGGVFTMAGSSPTARPGLFSDTRIDFTGTITGSVLTLSAGTALPVGAIVSQRSGLIPAGLAQLLPGRPVITGSFGLTSYSISPALTTPVGPTAIAMSAGRPAYFTMLPGSSAPNLLWVTTQDINSIYGNPLFPSESFNDTAGQPNPSLYRTVNWGELSPPGLPLARTFCS